MDPQIAGYLARSAFSRASAQKQASAGSMLAGAARQAGVGALTGAASGAFNNDGQTSLGKRVVRGAVGGAIAGGTVGGLAIPLAGKGYHAAMKRFYDPTHKPKADLGALEHNIVGGVMGVMGGVAGTT